MHDANEPAGDGGTANRTNADAEGSTDGDGAGDGTSRRRVMQGTGAAVTATALGNVPGAAAQSSETREVVAVGCQGNGTVTIADANTYEVVDSFDSSPNTNSPSLTDPIKKIAKPIIESVSGRQNVCEHVILDPSGERIYVSRANIGDTLAIDLETKEELWRCEMVGFRSDHAVLSDDGSELFVSDIMADVVWKVDPETGEKLDHFPTGDWPHGLHVHDGRVYNGSLGSMVFPDEFDGDHQVTVADRETMEIVDVFEFEEGVRPMAFTSDHRTMYLQISYMHGFHEVDPYSGEILRTKDLPTNEHVPDNEDDYPLQSAHHGIEVSPDDRYICAAGTTGNYAAVVDRETFETVNITDVGKYPYWCKNAPDGEHCFVSVKDENKVSVIEYATGEEVDSFETGPRPMVTSIGEVPESYLDGSGGGGDSGGDDSSWLQDLFGW